MSPARLVFGVVISLLAGIGASVLVALIVDAVLSNRCGRTCAGLQEPAEPPRKRRRRMIAAAHILPRAGLPTTTVRAERGDDVGELAASLARAGASILSGERHADS